MKRRSRDLSIFNMSALDVLATATGTFVLLVVMLMPYYRHSFDAKAEIEDTRVSTEQLLTETDTIQTATASLDDGTSDLRSKAEALRASSAAARAERTALQEASLIDNSVLVRTTEEVEDLAAIVDRRTIRELDLVFVVDTTASMGPALRDMSLSLSGIVRVLERLVPSLRVGFVAYRDHDVPGWLTRQLPLTPTVTNLNTVLSFADGLRPPPRGGRTVPEAVYEALNEATRMPFRPTAKQTIILVGDARAHARRRQLALRLASSFAAFSPKRSVSALFVPTRGYLLYGQGDREFFQAVGRAGDGEFTDHTGRMTESVLLSVLSG